MTLTVLKFGSSVLHDDSCIPLAVQEIYRAVRDGERVIAVVSAFRGTTDSLLDRARSWGNAPAALAMMLATGEIRAAALLGLALDRAGIPTTVLEPRDLGIKTCGKLLDAEPYELDTRRLTAALASHEVVVVPGFVGLDADKRTSLLGRGGSDLTALFITAAMGADRCRLVKDVDGLYEVDPNTVARPRRFAATTWDRALELDEGAIQRKATRLARDRQVRFELGRFGESVYTLVGADQTVLEAPPQPVRPLRVGLLGVGTVNLGVYRGLLRHPDRFELVLGAVLDPAKHEAEGLPQGFLTTSAAEVVAAGCDIIVEAMGGRTPTSALVRRALGNGAHVVTANKDLIANEGTELHALAEQSGVRLLYSAAVGGGVPMIETVHRASEHGALQRLEGVLNGTTNFVLDRMLDGVNYADAVGEAQAAGFAEADPTLDVDGTDVAHKLTILARIGFGASIEVGDVDRRGIDDLDPALMEAARASGRKLRLVGTCELVDGEVRASIRPTLLDADHPLAQVTDEHNRLLVTLADGATVECCGKGAGRWPTSEAVVADILEIYRDARGAAPRHGRRAAFPLRALRAATQRRASGEPR